MIEKEVYEQIYRRSIINKVVDEVCAELLSRAKRVRVGIMHRAVASRLNVFSSSWLKARTNERLEELKIKRVTIHGYSYFREQ